MYKSLSEKNKKTLQLYKNVSNYRVSDDNSVVVRQDSIYGSKFTYALPGNIKASVTA